MYQKVDTNLNFVDREKKVEKFWKDNDIFEKSMENRKEGPTYTFYDGPPTANGKPHIGHVLVFSDQKRFSTVDLWMAVIMRN